VGKNVAVFVDVANIFYAAKAAGVDIDYVLLLKAATAGRDLVRAYAYTGLDPDNENQRNFHSFLARHGFRVVSKDIRKYGDGKVKANLDIELVVDLMKTSRNLDVAVVVSGDGDFAPAIRAVQETGVRVEVISFRGNTSADLIEVADRFTDITQLAKGEKAAAASSRQAATRDEDLSMTEVPDKESERSLRGRGRGRVRVGERGRAAGAPAEESRPAAAAPPIVALPGEKLSKAAVASAAAAAAREASLVDGGDGALGVTGEAGVEGDREERRRRRRRGGRGRGRGRGHDLGAPEGAPAIEEVLEYDDEDVAAEPARPVARPAAFGSVWDSQIGVPSAPSASGAADAEEFDDEPAIPEYLLTERQRGGRGAPHAQRARPRGRGGDYARAVERERFGGRGAGRPAEPIHRGARGEPRPPRFAPAAPARDRGPGGRGRAEPWSEVPPELEELLRAQLAQKVGRPQPTAPAAEAGVPAHAAAEEAAPAAPRRRSRRPTAAAAAAAEAAGPSAEAGAHAPPAPAAEEAAPRRRPRRPTASAAAAEGAAPAAEVGTAPAPAVEETAPAAPRRRSRRPTAPAAEDGAPAHTAVEEAAPVAPRRRTRRPTAPAAAAAEGAGPAGEVGAPAGDA
jgi:uncharacterized LabA/DUF88 family protein